jgi:hypothetical protein
MNTIHFQLAAYEGSDATEYLVVEIRIDGELLADFRWYATDLQAVQQSCERPGPAFIVTCWCGYPGCAGLHYGLNVYHEGTTIRWRIPEPLPARTVIFQRTAYEAAYRDCLKQGKRLIAARRYTPAKPFTITPDSNERFFALNGSLKRGGV